jgi:hypothetical protein
MLALVKQDTTLVVVLSHDGREIERGVAPSGDAAVRLAVMMLAWICEPATCRGCWLRLRAPARYADNPPCSGKPELNDLSARSTTRAASQTLNAGTDARYRALKQRPRG